MRSQPPLHVEEAGDRAIERLEPQVAQPPRVRFRRDEQRHLVDDRVRRVALLREPRTLFGRREALHVRVLPRALLAEQAAQHVHVEDAALDAATLDRRRRIALGRKKGEHLRGPRAREVHEPAPELPPLPPARVRRVRAEADEDAERAAEHAHRQHRNLEPVPAEQVANRRDEAGDGGEVEHRVLLPPDEVPDRELASDDHASRAYQRVRERAPHRMRR